MSSDLHLFLSPASPYDAHMRKTIHVFTLAFTLIFPAVGHTAGTSTISGRVFGETPGQGITGARLRLLLLNTVMEDRLTDAFGEFEFSGLPAGRYIIEVNAPGYLPSIVEANPGESRETVYLFIGLKRLRDKETRVAETISVAEFLIPKRAREEFERAKKQQEKSNCAGALKHLEQAVKTYSQYTAAHNEMGNCYVRLGKLDRAEGSFKQAVALATTVYPSINLADLYVQQRRFEEARAVLNAAIRSNPGQGDAYYALALTYFDEGRIDEAERVALQADSRRHAIADLHLLLAKIYAKKQNASETIRQLKTFVEEAPGHPMAEQVRRELNGVSR
jgi:tetratricopeptide (TPR) repeat protein